MRKSTKEILCAWTLKYVNKIPGRRVPTLYWPIVTFPPDLTASKQTRCAEASVTMATMTSAACQWSGFVHEKEWMRKWRIKREAVKKGWEEIWERGWKEREHGYPHFIALCYQHVALSARLQSILCESLINEAGALGQPSHISTSPGCAPPYLSFHVLSFAPYDTFLYDR